MLMSESALNLEIFRGIFRDKKIIFAAASQCFTTVMKLLSTQGNGANKVKC